jgi:hypothetical protein
LKNHGKQNFYEEICLIKQEYIKDDPEDFRSFGRWVEAMVRMSLTI